MTLFRIVTSKFVAGYVVSNGVVARCAPILRKHLQGKKEHEAAAIARRKGWTLQNIKGMTMARDKSRGSFKYKRYDPEKIKQKATRDERQFDSIFKEGFEIFKPNNGENVIRYLPATWEDPEDWGYTVYIHNNIGPDRSMYLCPKKMKQKPCAICDAAEQARREGEKDDAKEMAAQECVVSWIIDRNADDELPKLYRISWRQHRANLDLAYNKRTGAVLYVDDPNEGYDMTFRRVGQGKKTRYSAHAWDRDSTPLHDNEKVQKNMLEYVEDNPIPSVLQFYSNEYLESVVNGVSERDRDEDEKPKSRGRPEPDDDEEEKPRRGRVKDEELPEKMRSKRDEEEEAPRSRRRDDDDDEADEKPRSRQRASIDDEEEKPRSRRGDDNKGDEAEEEEEAPRSRRSRDEDEDEKPRSRRSRDDEEEEAPRSRRRAAAGDDEEEEEVRPRRRSRD